MDIFSNFYNSPLFGVWIVVFIAIIIVVTNYIFSKFQEIKNIKKAKDISKSQNYLTNNYDYEQLIASNLIGISSFKQAINHLIELGEFEKSLSIIHAILKISNEQSVITEFMSLLAKVYIKLGVYDKSEQVLVEYLGINPRSNEALGHLFIIYVKLKNYTKAYDVCESLNELNEDIKGKKLFLDIHSNKIKPSNYNDVLNNISGEESFLRAFYKFLFYGNLDFLLKEIKDFDKIILDLLYNIRDKNQVQNILSKNENIGDILSINNKINTTTFVSSDIEEIKLIHLARQNNIQIDLEFTYTCETCNTSYAIDIDICPNCYCAFSLVLQTNIKKKVKQEDKKD
jgi:tetratricopeptide (TPR) repeat protein